MPRNCTGKPQPTMEFGHTQYGQYSGITAVLCDPRPNTRTKRGVSPDDDPARVAWIEEVEKRYRKDEE